MESHTQFRRRSIRIKTHNYANNGVYFVTICTYQRELFFNVPTLRQIAEQCWINIPHHVSNVELDEWVVMPNHLHGVLFIHSTMNAPAESFQRGFSPPQKNSLGLIVRTYKGAVTTLCRRAGNLEFRWQRNYYEHIIRNEAELNRIRQYIMGNPSNWETDDENPKRRL
jgi:REP element-mobilizing transposase RayT